MEKNEEIKEAVITLREMSEDEKLETLADNNVKLISTGIPAKLCYIENNCEFFVKFEN